ncbi:predicted protein [Histoplasma capsulatum H143]|uniref:Uncharacterized protein n=1 Tax=Ajellomyces capsulatus (strain H143) TaxID=544712 RepID=C6HIC9_AJECH|nr:predicted protein [Histoplasma capsulatum H143]
MNSFQTFSTTQPGLQFIPYQPTNISKAAKLIKAVDSSIPHMKTHLAEPRKPSPTRIATTPPATFLPLLHLQLKNWPAGGGQDDNPASNDEDPLCGLFSNDEEPAINQGWDDRVCHQSYKVLETQGAHIENSQDPPGPNTDSGDDDKSSSQGPNNYSSILILDDKPCPSGRNSSIQEDSSQPGTVSEDVSAPPGTIEQPEISSHCQEDALDVIEVVDKIMVPETTPRRSRKKSKIMPQSSPVKCCCTNRCAPADQVTQCWEYKTLISYELRNGDPWVRVAWCSSWEPGKEFPRHQVEEARHLQMKGEGGANITNRLRQARKLE